MSAFKKQKTGDESDSKSNVLSTTSETKMLELNSWLLSNKVVGLGLVDFRYSGDECGGSLGCFARERIMEGDTIFIIPQTCIIGINNANNTMLSHFIRITIAKHKLPFIVTSELLIWLFMIEERAKKDGEFQVYLSSLDVQSPTLLTWDSSLLDALEGTNLGNSTESSREQLMKHVQLLDAIHIAEPIQSGNLLPKHVFNETALIWARGHYLARRYPGDFAIQSTFKPVKSGGKVRYLMNFVVLLFRLNVNVM